MMCVVIGGGGFKDRQRELQSKKKRTLSENFHLSPHMKALLAQSQGFGRPGVLFRKTLMTMDRANEKRRRKRRKEGIMRGAEKRGK